jgi:hypothetical protein
MPWKINFRIIYWDLRGAQEWKLKSKGIWRNEGQSDSFLGLGNPAPSKTTPSGNNSIGVGCFDVCVIASCSLLKSVPWTFIGTFSPLEVYHSN